MCSFLGHECFVPAHHHPPHRCVVASSATVGINRRGTAPAATQTDLAAADPTQPADAPGESATILALYAAIAIAVRAAIANAVGASRGSTVRWYNPRHVFSVGTPASLFAAGR